MTHILLFTVARPLDDLSVPRGLATLSLAVVLGLALGAIRVRGIRLGVSGVLFSALLFGQIGLTVDARVLGFLRDFALIIFIYSVGLQVGPSFLASLRAEGLRLNLLSIAAIVLGAVFTGVVVTLFHLSHELSSGLYSGAYTTTPGLAAGQEALKHALASPDRAVAAAGLAYTVTYPLGVLGPSLAIVVLRRLFRVRIEEEAAQLKAARQGSRPQLQTIEFEVTEPAHAGKALREHPLIKSHDVIFSRLWRDKAATVPSGDTEVRVGDIYRVFGPHHHVTKVVAEMGRPAQFDFDRATGDIRRQEILVTRTRVLRRTLRELDLPRRAGVTITRITRAGVDLLADASLRLQFGDLVTFVGPAAGLKVVERELGNCPETLNRPQLVPIFLGVVLGVFVGTIPLRVPGLGTTLRLGLAGGPMLVALILSQLGNIGSVVWYMPVAANQLFRDFGLAVFLACVGLQAGDQFVERVRQGGAVALVVFGLAISILPVLVVGAFARWRWKMNFVTLSGWVAGAMTSSPALLFASDMTHSEEPAIAYAAVAPLGMLTPIICAQLLVVFLR
jgi:putative transport protein